MKFRNQRHREMFTKAIHRLDRGNYTLMAVVYLFAADIRLWSMTEKSIYYSGVDFSRIRLRNCSEGLYTLVLCSQRPVLRYRQTYHRQPCDAEVVPPKVIKKCGLYRTMLRVNDAREAVKIPGHQRFEPLS